MPLVSVLRRMHSEWEENMKRVDSICQYSLSEVVHISTPKPEQYIMNELFVLSGVGMSTPAKLYIAYSETWYHANSDIIIHNHNILNPFWKQNGMFLLIWLF
jgi:hypothetical protein